MPTRNFRELLEAMPPDRQRRIENRFRKSLAAMPLDQLRKAQQMTQLQLAEILGVNQGEVSKIEHRRDICISTLAEYIEAMGGRLEIRAVFKDREVRIAQFERSEERRVGKECRSRWSPYYLKKKLNNIVGDGSAEGTMYHSNIIKPALTRGESQCVGFFFFSSRRRHTRCLSDWSSDVCSSDLSAALRAKSWRKRNLLNGIVAS